MLGRLVNEAEVDGFFEAGDRVEFREKFVSEEAIEVGVGDGFGDGGVKEFLLVVEFVATGVTGGVVVTEVLMVIADGANDITLHDLHVVDIVEEFEVIGADAFDEFDTPIGAIAHVIFVIDAAVEEFHVEDDVMFFGDGGDFFESLDAVLHSGFAIDTAGVPGEADDISPTFFGGGLDNFV